MLQSAPANQRRACRVSCTATPFVSSHLHAVSVSLAIATRTPIKTSLTRHRWGAVSGSLSTCPHGDLHSSVKGRGPVFISADLILSSVVHK